MDTTSSTRMGMAPGTLSTTLSHVNIENTSNHQYLITSSLSSLWSRLFWSYISEEKRNARGPSVTLMKESTLRRINSENGCRLLLYHKILLKNHFWQSSLYPLQQVLLLCIHSIQHKQEERLFQRSQVVLAYSLQSKTEYIYLLAVGECKYNLLIFF